MKINITGRGVIPGIGTIPPVYNRELSEKSIMRLLNFQNFKLYDSESGVLITKKNITDIINNKTAIVEEQTQLTDNEEPTVIEETQTTPIVEDYTHSESGLITDDIVAETTIEETVVDEVVSDTVEEEPAVIEETETVSVNTETVSDEATESVANNQQNHKKNKKHRN